MFLVQTFHSESSCEEKSETQNSQEHVGAGGEDVRGDGEGECGQVPGHDLLRELVVCEEVEDVISCTVHNTAAKGNSLIMMTRDTVVQSLCWQSYHSYSLVNVALDQLLCCFPVIYR